MAGRHGSNDINGSLKGLLGERCTAWRINRKCSRPTVERQDVVDGDHGCSHLGVERLDDLACTVWPSSGRTLCPDLVSLN